MLVCFFRFIVRLSTAKRSMPKVAYKKATTIRFKNLQKTLKNITMQYYQNWVKDRVIRSVIKASKMITKVGARQASLEKSNSIGN